MNSTLHPFAETNTYEDLILSMESIVLDGGTVDVGMLSSLPDTIVQNSPLLLKLQGELWLREGKLPQAKAAMLSAVQGFMRQSFQPMLMDALAQLSMIHLRIGEGHEAVTILTFLKEEWERKESQMGGRVPQALLWGSYLLDERGMEQTYFQAAWSLFEMEGDSQRCMELGLEQLLYWEWTLSEEESNRIVLYMEQKSKLNASLKPLYLFALGVANRHKGQWAAAITSLKAVETSKLSYEFSTSCLINHIAARLNARMKIDPLLWAELDQAAVHYESDVNLQFQYNSICYLRSMIAGEAEQAASIFNRLKAWQQLIRNPAYTLWMQQVNTYFKDIMRHEHQKPEQDSKKWEISCFGKLKFWQEGTEIKDVSWKRKKSLELFIYLLTQPDFSAPKERVMEMLLGQSDTEKMNNQLYVALHQLKQTLKRELDMDQGILMKEGLISLNADLISGVDIERYHTLIGMGDQFWNSDHRLSIEFYEKASLMYGEFVPEISYADWINSYREVLVTNQVKLLRRMSLYYREQEQFDLAEACFHHWINIRPMEEEGYQELIGLLMAAGRTIDAHRWYKKWEQLCRDEFGLTPLEETRKLIDS